MQISRTYTYKGVDIELFSDGKYITKYALSKNGEIYEEDSLENVTRDLTEALLSDIYYDIDNEEEK